MQLGTWIGLWRGPGFQEKCIFSKGDYPWKWFQPGEISFLSVRPALARKSFSYFRGWRSIVSVRFSQNVFVSTEPLPLKNHRGYAEIVQRWSNLPRCTTVAHSCKTFRWYHRWLNCRNQRAPKHHQKPLPETGRTKSHHLMEIPIWGRDPNSSYFGLEMTQIRAKKEPKVAKMSQNELKRAKKKPQLAKMSQNEPKYAKMSQNEPKWAKMSQKRVRMGQNGRIRARLGTSGHISGPKTTDFGPTRESLKPGLIWDSPLNGATFLVIWAPTWPQNAPNIQLS